MLPEQIAAWAAAGESETLEMKRSSYRGQAYRRVGATDRAMSRDEYNRLLLEQVHSEHRWENESASDWTVADLNQTEIVRTVEEAIRRRRAEEPGTRDPVELLRGLGLIHEGRLLRAAVVLFGRAERLEMFYPQCLLRVAKFRGVDSDRVPRQSANVRQCL